MLTTCENYYIDITKNYINKKVKKRKRIEILEYYQLNGKKYFIDGRHVKIDVKEKELLMAKYLKDTFGGVIYLVPKVDEPSFIKTPDFYWRGEYWDLKEILGNGKNNIGNKVKNSKGQTSNYILDNSKLVMSNEEAINQIKHIYRDKERNWVDKIILIENKKIIKVFKKNKKEW